MENSDLRYSETHEWVRVQDDTATVGITDYAQNELGDIVNVEFLESGRTVQTGERFGSIDSVKAVSDLVSPVSGEIVEVNEDLVEAPELINEEPYAGGWMIILKMDDPSDLDSLMSPEEYEEYTATL